MRRAHVAQVAERVLGKDKVTGSNPVVGSSEGLRYNSRSGMVNRELASRFTIKLDYGSRRAIHRCISIEETTPEQGSAHGDEQAEV